MRYIFAIWAEMAKLLEMPSISKKRSVADSFERLPEKQHPPQPEITRVHLFFKTHFDVGFTQLADTVLQRYWETYWPQALELFEHLRKRPDGVRFRWATGSWLVTAALERLKGRSRRAFEQAILDGAVTWHALPFTFETESLSASLYRSSFRYADVLAKRFGIHSRVVKQTDVPGHTWGMLPILAEQGIELFHLGINPASALPKLPMFFRWRHLSGSEIPVILEHDYGGTQVIPGTTEAFSFRFTADNHGPQTVAQIEEAHALLRRRFPNAAITTSSFNDLADAVRTSAASWPVFEGEIGDSWIRGYASDPWKMSRFRELQRLRGEWEQAGKLRGAWVPAFEENLLLTAEHTWGLDEKSHLTNGTLHQKERTYRKKDFLPLLDTAPFRALAASWDEQRGYIKAAVKALDDAPAALRREADSRLAALDPSPRSSRKPAVPPKPATGWGKTALARLDLGTGRVLEGIFGQVLYEAYGSDDYETFKREYIHPPYLASYWAVPDFTKPGLEKVLRRRRQFVARVVSLQETTDRGQASWLVELKFPKLASEKYGAPRRLQMLVRLPIDSLPASWDLQWFDKDPYRGAEAIWFQFQPKVSVGARWLFHKMDTLVDSSQVCKRAGRPLHGIDEGAVLREQNCSDLYFHSLDAALAGPGLPNPLALCDRIPPAADGISFNLFNNTWTTNFPMWNGDDARFRFEIGLETKLFQKYPLTNNHLSYICSDS